MLTQKDDENNEWPISLMSASLQVHEINYISIDKNVYPIYNVVKHLHPYFLKNNCIIFFPHPTVRSLFGQQEMGERRSN